MSNPPIWQLPAADAVIKNGTRSFVDGDTVAIDFAFTRAVTKVRYIKGTLPYGVNATAAGINGTLARKNPPNDTPPRDYTITVRAYSNATATEIANGTPAEFYEDRTFTIVGGLWHGPAAGRIRSASGNPLQRGDTVVTPFTFDPGRTITNVTIIGGELVPGLAFSGISKRIAGQVAALPKDKTEIPILLRAKIKTSNNEEAFQDRTFIYEVNPLDEQHGWDAAWLAGLPVSTNTTTGDKIYSLGTIYRGGSIEIQLKLNNPDNDPLTFKTTGYIYDTGTRFSNLPDGLEIDDYGRIIGAADIATNDPGDYYFKIYAREPSGTEGKPKTSEIVFKLTLSSEIRLDPYLSDSIKWLTPVGSLGSTYETHASHFAIRAVPQFQMTSITNEVQKIRYRLVGNKPLPSGLMLDQDTGDISGRLPYVQSERTYDFVIRASVYFQNSKTGAVRNSSTFSDRTFSITVKSLYTSDAVSDLYITVPPFDRLELAHWVYGTKPEYKEGHPRAPDILTVLGRDVLYRRTDPAWGKIQNPKILLIGGLNSTTPANLINKLTDYHHVTELRIGSLHWAKGYDPSGNYVYDMIYFSITDPMEGAGGFNSFGRDVIQPMPHNKAVPSMNLPANSDRYHPTSIANVRKDLINTIGRAEWPSNNESAESRGVGLAGREGLPLWMSCEQTPGEPSSRIGYIPAIELAYLKPGKGAQAVKSLQQAGFQKSMQGRVIKVDRYLLISDGYQALGFDINIELDTKTTFDGPDAAEPTPSYTTFDEILKPEVKYYKFPPGDVPN